MPFRYSGGILWITFLLLVTCCCCMHTTTARSSTQTQTIPSSASSSNCSSSSSSIQTTTTTPQSSSQSQSQSQQVVVVVLYETEEYINGHWRDASTPTGRWSTSLEESEQQSSPPPTSLQPPIGYQWEGDWKIITHSDGDNDDNQYTTRDSLGWTYFVWRSSSNTTTTTTTNTRVVRPMRRRTWLRQCTRTTATTTTTIQHVVPPSSRRRRTTKLLLYVQQQRRRRHRLLQQCIQLIQEEWNFKGFGIAVYKSLLMKEACGIAVRIPLTLNLDFWERQPGLPSISSSLELYYPPTAAIFLSASLNLDYLKWLLETAMKLIRHFFRKCVYNIYCCLGMYNNWRKQQQQQQQQQEDDDVVQQLQLDPPHYNLDISERIGMSLSWRISAKRGYEFRVSYSHSYLPTVLYYWHTWLIRNVVWRWLVPNAPLLAEHTMNWLKEKTGSFGISTSGPTPDPPHFSCNTLMSFSGFHLFQKQRQQQQRQQQQYHHPTVEQSIKENDENEISSSSSTTTTTSSSVRVTDMEKVTV